MRVFVILFLVTFLSACSTRHPIPVDSLVLPGAVVETLNSSVLVSLRTEGKNITARGMILYKRPDMLRFVMLSPFGTSMLDALVEGDTMTVLYPADAVAFTGAMKEHSAGKGLKGWGMLMWVLDTALPAGVSADGITDRIFPFGAGSEKLFTKNGLVVEKSLPGGETVKYSRHKVLAGIRLPLEMLFDSTDGYRIRIQLEEPEVNQELSNHIFKLKLNNVTRRPLSELKAM